MEQAHRSVPTGIYLPQLKASRSNNQTKGRSYVPTVGTEPEIFRLSLVKSGRYCCCVGNARMTVKLLLKFDAGVRQRPAIPVASARGVLNLWNSNPLVCTLDVLCRFAYCDCWSRRVVCQSVSLSVTRLRCEQLSLALTRPEVNFLMLLYRFILKVDFGTKLKFQLRLHLSRKWARNPRVCPVVDSKP